MGRRNLICMRKGKICTHYHTEGSNVVVHVINADLYCEGIMSLLYVSLSRMTNVFFFFLKQTPEIFVSEKDYVQIHKH